MLSMWWLTHPTWPLLPGCRPGGSSDEELWFQELQQYLVSQQTWWLDNSPLPPHEGRFSSINMSATCVPSVFLLLRRCFSHEWECCPSCWLQVANCCRLYTVSVLHEKVVWVKSSKLWHWLSEHLYLIKLCHLFGSPSPLGLPGI